MNNSNIKHLAVYLSDHVRSLIVVAIALLSVAASLLSIGYVFRKLVDLGVGADQLSEIHNSVYLISVLIAVFASGSFFRSYFINVITLKVVSKLKSDTYRNLLKIDIVRFENLKVGDIISRLGSDIEVIGDLITNFLSFFVRNSIMLTGAIILMFVHSPKLSLLVVVIVPILLIPLLRLSKHVRKLSRHVLVEQSLLASNIDENFTGIRTLYAYNQQGHSADKFDKKITTYINHASARLKMRALFFALAITIIAGSITVVIWIGSIDILTGSMSSGQMISFIYYAIIVGMSAGGIAELFSEIQGPLAALDRVLELKSITSISSSETTKNTPSDSSIEFDSVSFSYPARPDIIVLNDISLKIQNGMFTGIVGRSGSGKSTLMQILLKFYKHKAGRVSIGSVDITSLKEEDVRKKIAYVEQHPTIFSGTIRSNIAFSRPDAKDSEIDEVADLCGITDFASELDFTLDTEIGERGVRISGGQKQRIAIARALLYKPEILLLDEATSALDNDSEKKLLQNIRTLLPNKTIISIAHRVSSIESADEILVIDQGILDASGTHKELLKNSEIYNILYSEETTTE